MAQGDVVALWRCGGSLTTLQTILRSVPRFESGIFHSEKLCGQAESLCIL